MLEDVISPKGSLVENLLELSKGDKYDIYRSKPDNCCKCGSKEVRGVEIMGARNGVLLWECDKCFEMFLKYEAEETEAALQKAKGYWTNANDWGCIPKSKFN